MGVRWEVLVSEGERSKEEPVKLVAGIVGNAFSLRARSAVVGGVGEVGRFEDCGRM